MARVKPRSNVYALMTILASLIMAFGCWLTYDQGLRPYITDQPPPKTLPVPDTIVPIEKPEPTEAMDTVGTPATGGMEEGTEGAGAGDVAPGEGDVAPGEGAGTEAPGAIPDAGAGEDDDPGE
jgi:hypothetical protein